MPINTNQYVIYTEEEEVIKQKLINICNIMTNCEVEVGGNKRFSLDLYTYMMGQIFKVLSSGENTSGTIIFKNTITNMISKKNSQSNIKKIKHFLKNIVNFMDNNPYNFNFIYDYSIYNNVDFTQKLAYYNN
jgi:hypothetical protein